MKLLVTGAPVMSAASARRFFSRRGHEVVVVDDLSTGNADAVFRRGALRPRRHGGRRPGLLGGGSFDGVLHFAAKSLVGESVVAPELYWFGNVVKTLELLEAIRVSGTPRLVFSSTASTYGEPESVPITEDAPTRPTNAYGATKLAIDHAITSYATAHGLAATSLRYFNVAGAYAGLGERHATETHLIPLVLQVARGARGDPVFGDDWPTPDGTCIRDYIHVRDLADAHVLALATAQPGAHGIYNLGNGTGFGAGGDRLLRAGHRRAHRRARRRTPRGRPGRADRLQREGDHRTGLAAAAHLHRRDRRRRLGVHPLAGPATLPFASVRVCTATRRGTGHSGHAAAHKGDFSAACPACTMPRMNAEFVALFDKQGGVVTTGQMLAVVSRRHLRSCWNALPWSASGEGYTAAVLRIRPRDSRVLTWHAVRWWRSALRPPPASTASTPRPTPTCMC